MHITFKKYFAVSYMEKKIERPLNSDNIGDNDGQIFIRSTKRQYNSRCYQEKQAVDQVDLEETHPVLVLSIEAHRLM